LGGDREIASAGVGYSDAKANAAQPISGGKMPDNGPRLEVGIDFWGEARGTDVFRFGHRARIQRVQMVGQPDESARLATADR
jgi:hypothetical protein